jgi:streptogramin lyase
LRCATLTAAAALALTALSGDPPDATADVGTITEYPIPTATSEPRGITAGPDGRLWFAEYYSGKIGRITTGGVIDELTLPTAFAQPQGITTGPDGNLWFTDVGNGGAIGRIPGTATSGSEASEIAAGSAGPPADIVTGPDGRLWFTQPAGSTGHIGVLATNATQSSDIQEFAVQPGSNPHPFGIVNGPDGKLWFTTNGTSQIGHIAPPGADVPDTDLIPVTSGPLEITLGPDGNLWAAGSGASTITRITPSGTVTEFPTVHPNRLPTAIAAGPDGRIWFTEVGGTTHYIGVMTTDGVMTAADEFTIPGDNPSPQNITAGPDKRMWFTEFNGNKIGAITTGQEAQGGGGQQPPPGPGGGNPPGGGGQGPGVPVGCSPNKLVLTDVFPKGGKTRLLGVAPAGAAGKKVAFVSTWNKRAVARATVGADLSFSASAPLPPSRLRFSNRARYFVKLGKSRTSALKFARRMYTTAVTVSGRSATFSGVVTKPFAKPPQQVTIRASASCSSIGTGTIVATVKLSASGAFTAHFDLPAGSSTVFLRASTRVRKHATSKNTFPTFTLVRGLRLAS